MEKDIHTYVQSCFLSAQTKAPRSLPAGKLDPLPIFHRPWPHLSINYLTDLPSSQGFTTILVIIDRFSKACKLIPFSSIPTAFLTAEALFTHVFRNFGVPEDIVLDKGPQFTSQDFNLHYSPGMLQGLRLWLSINGLNIVRGLGNRPILTLVWRCAIRRNRQIDIEVIPFLLILVTEPMIPGPLDDASPRATPPPLHVGVQAYRVNTFWILNAGGGSSNLTVLVPDLRVVTVAEPLALQELCIKKGVLSNLLAIPSFRDQLLQNIAS
ncbi:hypothetical protein MHYP_G00128980 [Metynnis hypsauchen]